jgi:hypothetical protein
MKPSGTTHEHIERVKWENPANSSTGSSTVAEMVEFIEVKSGKAYTWDGVARADVGVVHPASGRPYIRTYADGRWTNNLLALPRF